MRKRKKSTFKKKIITTILLLLIFLSGIYVYNFYNNIEIAVNDYDIDKLESTVSLQDVDNIIQNSNDVADILEENIKSVVGISKLNSNSENVFTNNSEAQLGLGTGVIVSSNGYIISNEHVTGEKYSTCYVTLETGEVYNSRVVWSNKELDLSIIKIEAENLPYAILGDSEKIRIGEAVYAIGNPIGYEFRRTVTAGIISAKNRTIKLEEEQIYMSDLIQTDATINPGNSGGPLIYPNGEVIGINTVKITSAESIGFAVPINIIKPILKSFEETGDFIEAEIGIYAYDKDVIPYLNSDFNANLDKGIYVAEVIDGGPASKVGIQVGDIINNIDGYELETINHLKEYIYTKNPGDSVVLKITRDTLTLEIEIVLEET